MIGVIGAGHMGLAVAMAAQRGLGLDDNEIWLSKRNIDKRPHDRLNGAHWTNDNSMLIEQCDAIILAVKPQQAMDVLMKVSKSLGGKLVISIIAGWPYDKLERILPSNARFICAMPNMPLEIGHGITLLSTHGRFDSQDMSYAQRLFEGGGKVVFADESFFAAANIVTGCAPAFACMFIEALADGCVERGVPREIAYQLVSEMLIGTAQMITTAKSHPGVLKDNICSPNGTTIAGVHALETGSFRGTVMDAVSASYKRHMELEGYKM